MLHGLLKPIVTRISLTYGRLFISSTGLNNNWKHKNKVTKSIFWGTFQTSVGADQSMAGIEMV